MESTLGMVKIVDHKTDEHGHIFYKVQWEATWEPAESLTDCQKLIEEFWLSLNEARTRISSNPKRKRIQAECAPVPYDSLQLPDLEQWRNYPILNAVSEISANNQGIKIESKGKTAKSDNEAMSSSASHNSHLGPNQSISSQGLQYIENFDNPYVKVVLVCKICNKEQSMKFSGNWKQHYLTHSSNEEKPHKCSVCGKAFVRHDKMVKHSKTHGPLKKEEF